MSICADQLPGACKNMYMIARLHAGVKSRGQAEGLTFISERTLAKIETSERMPKPEEVLMMADAYHQPALAMNYCQHDCPIGQRYSTKTEEKDLATAVLSILKEHGDVKNLYNRMIEIAADGVISEDEQDSMAEIFGELQELEKAIQSLKMLLMASGQLSILGMENRKPAPAMMVAEEQVAYGQKKYGYSAAR